MYIIKRFAKRFFSSDVILNIDNLFHSGDKLVFCGWIANKAGSVSTDITFKAASLSGNADCFEFNRDDVKAALSLPHHAQVKGVLCVLDGITGYGELDKLQLTFSGQTRQLKKLRFRGVNSLAEMVQHIPAKQEEAKSFLLAHGLKLDKKGSLGTSMVVRHRDKDVEKIKSVVAEVNLHKAGFVDVISKNILPEVHKIWSAKLAKIGGAALRVYGTQANTTSVSVIIPLYGRYDFMQHQLAQFSADPDMQQAEIIFVLDDPALVREVEITAHGLYQTFRFPFKLLLSEKNRGFAGANNLGAEYASSEYILLLNSDILPCKKGWLSGYLAQFAGLADAGILGATLLYEDNTIQHAGMCFREDSHYPGIWMNHHPYKGVPADLVPLTEVFETPITTGACMLMKRSVYNDIGGFDPMYVLGDFEDSDLCLKVRDRGLRVYCSGGVRLYHLERLSQDLVDSGDWKFKLTITNGVYQVSKWRALIEEMAG